LVEVDLLCSTHALGKCGLFENVEMKMKALHKKGDTVNIFQMSVSKGLIFEGKAVVLKVLDPNGMDEYYHVRFLGRDGKPALGEEYDRFVDRQGQGDPDQYVKDMNKKLNIA